MIKKTLHVDEDTGEIYFQKENNYKIFDPSKGYLYRAKNYSRKSYADIKLSDVVKDRMDFLRVHLLAENIYKDTNAIAVRINTRKIRMADIEDVAKIIDLSIKKSKEFINRMKKLTVIAIRTDVIGDIVQEKYIFNPLFFSSNKYLHPDLYFLFQDSLDYYLPKWVIAKYHEFGNIKSDK